MALLEHWQKKKKVVDNPKYQWKCLKEEIFPFDLVCKTISKYKKSVTVRIHNWNDHWQYVA